MQLPLFEANSTANTARIRRIAVPVKPQVATVDSARNAWKTPAELLKLVGQTLGTIDLDPCSLGKAETNVAAKQHFSPDESSLTRSWQGRVWLNPPYGRALATWVKKLCDEYENGGVTAAIVLVPGRTDTDWWRRLAGYPYCALYGKVKFARIDGKKSLPNYPSAVVYLGPQIARFSSTFAEAGTIYIPYSA